MKIHGRSIVRWGMVVAIMFMTIVAAGSVGAQATRTWVSGVGDDANPCSRTAPCKTFAGAISKTAAEGEINVLDPGGFGAVTITKAITIDGSGGSIAGVIVSGTNGIVVSAGLNDTVILRNLDIDGLETGLSGIKFLAGGMLYVENTTIKGFTAPGIAFEPSGTSGLSVDRVFVRKNSGGGLLVKPGSSGLASVKVSDSRFEQNLYGVRVEDGSDVTISGSIANSNKNSGFVAASTTNPVGLNLDNCVSTNNGVGGVTAGGAGATIHISHSAVNRNAIGINALFGAGIVSFGDNRIANNTTNGAPTSVIPQE